MLARISHTISREGVQDATLDLFSLRRKHCPSDKESLGKDKDDAADYADSPREYGKCGLVGSALSSQEIPYLLPYVDIIECRLDQFSLKARPGHPVIFTLRRNSGVDESVRLKKIEEYLALQPDYFDLEVETDPNFIEYVKKTYPKVKLILSAHDFEKTPQNLESYFEKIINPHADIYKLAFHANSSSDMLRLMHFCKTRREKISFMSLGEFGSASRVIAPILNSALNYVGIEEDPVLGRMSLKTLLNTYKYRSLNENTKIYALIGDPVDASFGHIYHNEYFDPDQVYVKIRVLQNDLEETIDWMKKLPFLGLSVTIPHKEAILPLLDQNEDTPIGAINTIVFQNGKLAGYNTDGKGIVQALEKRTQLEEKKIAILGAGGTARSAIYELKKKKARLFIFNRTFLGAEKLGREFGIEAFPQEKLGSFDYDILINTRAKSAPVSFDLLPEKIVMDVNYDPEETPLLKRAKEKHCILIFGKELFVQQARLQKKIWAKNRIQILA